jgi:hypothetical protein
MPARRVRLQTLCSGVAVDLLDRSACLLEPFIHVTALLAGENAPLTGLVQKRPVNRAEDVAGCIEDTLKRKRVWATGRRVRQYLAENLLRLKERT